MKTEVKKKWIDALRSGEYEQATGTLHDKGQGFCCLGILTDLYIKEHPSEKWEDCKLYPSIPRCQLKLLPPFDDTYEASVLPPQVVGWAGLESSDPIVKLIQESDMDLLDRFRGEPLEVELSLSQVNDNLCKGFKVIADLIEEQL